MSNQRDVSGGSRSRRRTDPHLTIDSFEDSPPPSRPTIHPPAAFDDSSDSGMEDMAEHPPSSSGLDDSSRPSPGLPFEPFRRPSPFGTIPPPPSFSNPALYSKSFLAYSPTIKFTYYSNRTDLRQAWAWESLLLPEMKSLGELFKVNDPFWFDVTAPTTDDLHRLAAYFGIHPLSIEDIQMRDSREKCEIFERYIFLCIRTCDQRFIAESPLHDDNTTTRARRLGTGTNSLGGAGMVFPASLYILVFSNYIISVHHEPLPQVQRALRRLYALKSRPLLTSTATSPADSSIQQSSFNTVAPTTTTTPPPIIIPPQTITSTFTMSADWVMYSLLDDAVDEFSPQMSRLQMEVDTIDDLVLFLTHTEQSDMLKRIGRARKQVTALLRLLKPKLDIIRILTKRCPEYLRPHTLLYFRDVNDHVLTNLQNLEQYGETLNRSHSNYLAQISIELNEASNRMNVVMKKLTIAAALLLPLSIISGLWGMNVPVPGQEGIEGWEPLLPFFSIILIMFLVVGLMYGLGRYLEWW